MHQYQRHVPIFGLLLALGAQCCEDNLGFVTCFNYLAVDADHYCGEVFCAECEYAGQCDTYCGLCEDQPLVLDCDGNKAPSSWIGDSFCDNHHYMYDSEFVNFNCPEYDCDGSDCESDDANGLEATQCATAPPSPESLPPTMMSSVAEIQTQFDNSEDVLLYDYDCFRSPLEKEIVTVRGIVTLVETTGFYLQDESGTWSGIFVLTTSHSSILSVLSPGNEVFVTRGFVDERLGETQLEVADADIHIVEKTRDPILSVATTLETLGGSFEKLLPGTSRDACTASAEPYEGVLVNLSNVTILEVLKDGFLEISDVSGERGIVLTQCSSFDPESYLRGIFDSDIRGVTIASVTGVVDFTHRCDPSSSYYACLSRNRGLTFASALCLRSSQDLVDISRGSSSMPTIDNFPTPAPQSYTDEDFVEVDFISRIQSQFTADIPSEYRCAPSAFDGINVRVDGFVTAIDGEYGFFLQDRPLLYSGIYVATYPSLRLRRRLLVEETRIGYLVRVVGRVVETLGRTTIEALDVQVLSSDRDRGMPPIRLESTSLKRFRSLSREGCDSSLEPYESMLVLIDDILILDERCSDCFDNFPLEYDGGSGLIDDHFYRDFRLDLLATAAREKVDPAFDHAVGIVRYAYECEHEGNPIYCTEGRGDFYFAFLFSPRDADDFIIEPAIKNAEGDDDEFEESGPSNKTTTFVICFLSSLFCFVSILLYGRRRRLHVVMLVDRPTVTEGCELETEIPMARAVVDADCCFSNERCDQVPSQQHTREGENDGTASSEP